MPFMRIYLYSLMITLFLFLHGNAQQTTEQDSVPKEFEQIAKDFSFHNAEIKVVARFLATRYNLNIFVDNSIQKQVTYHLVNQKIINILRLITSDNNLRLVRLGNIYKILTPEKPIIIPKILKVEVQNRLLIVDIA